MRRAYTLVEVLIVVMIVGIAGAMVIPTFGSTDALRIQGAVRGLVADITVQQSDAIAFQSGRGILFVAHATNSTYTLADVTGNTLDTGGALAQMRPLGGPDFAFCRIDSINLPGDMLVFDELGGPVVAPGSDVAAPAGWVDIGNNDQAFRVNIEAYTGRVTVQSIPPTTGGGGPIIP